MVMLFSVLAYAFFNRMAGDGVWKRTLKLPGRPIWYAAVLALFVMVPVWGWTHSAWCAFSFLVWRTLGWYTAIDAGTNTETRERDFLVLSLRGLMLFPVFIVQGAWVDLVVASLGIALCYHAAWHWVPRKPDEDRIPLAEWYAGAWLGLVFALIG